MKCFSLFLCMIFLTLISCTAGNKSPSQGPGLALASISPFVNTSDFYLNNKVWNCSGAPQQIAPHEALANGLSGAGCAFIACATSHYDTDQGCQENANGPNSGLTQGGYSTYFTINTETKVCTIAGFIPYQCTLDDSGKFTFGYRSVVQLDSSSGKAVKDTMPGKVANGTIPAVSQYEQPAMRGLNISGLEYDGTYLDAMFQQPDLPDFRYFAFEGMNTVRLPIRWEFIVTSPTSSVTSTDPMSTTINQIYMSAVHDTVQKYLNQGLYVILDLHNYMRFCPTGPDIGQGNEPTNAGLAGNGCTIVTKGQLAYIWGLLANQFSDLASANPTTLIFEVMNEPFSADSPASQVLLVKDVFDDEVAAVQAIRAKIPNSPIFLSGDFYDPLHGWTNIKQGQPLANGDQFTRANLVAAGITDLSNIVIDVHQYFNHILSTNTYFSGTTPDCLSVIAFKDQVLAGLQAFAAWERANGMKVFLGEFGASPSAECKEVVGYLLDFVNYNAYDGNSGFVGWTAWRANRHGTFFNALQKEDNTVYGAPLSAGFGVAHGIVQGPGNDMMNYFTGKGYLRPGAMPLP